MKAIIADPAVPRDICAPAIRQFLSFFHVPGENTLFRSVKKLLPGHYLVAEDGKISIRQYWDLQFTGERRTKPFDEVVEELYGLLGSTVRDHMIADVPVGVLLSGGVDSSALLSFAVERTEKKVNTFTVGFDSGQVVDERPMPAWRRRSSARNTMTSASRNRISGISCRHMSGTWRSRM